jgi:hypothetical protein
MYLIKSNQTEEQKRNLFLSNQAESFRTIAAMRGDKGSQRKPLTAKERDKRKVRQRMAKFSRKKNRKSA